VEVGGVKERRGDAERVANEMLGAVIFNASHMTLPAYLESFWDKGSAYFREREKVNGKPFSADYARSAQSAIRRHVGEYPPFASLPMAALSRNMLKDFMLWEAERGVSGARINRVLHVLRVPVRYALETGEIAADPFSRLSPAATKAKARGVLTLDEAERLLNAPVKSTKRRLAVLFGLLAGMREGEVRGLHWEDIEGDVIKIWHNWQDGDGIKGPKCDGYRTVFLDDDLKEALEAYRSERGGPSSGLVFGRAKDDRPVCAGFLQKGVAAELAGIGIPGKWTSRGGATLLSTACAIPL
jgi:integrase